MGQKMYSYLPVQWFYLGYNFSSVQYIIQSGSFFISPKDYKSYNIRGNDRNKCLILGTNMHPNKRLRGGFQLFNKREEKNKIERIAA